MSYAEKESYRQGNGGANHRPLTKESTLYRYLGFDWTGWSTTPMTLSIITLCWALAFSAVSLGANLLGFGGVAEATAGIAKVLLALFGLLLAMSLAAGIFWKVPAGRPATHGSRRP